MTRGALAYYVTAHGYGHGVRSSDILRELTRQRPDRRVIIVSDLPADFFTHRLGGGRVTVRRAVFDVGMVQVDSIRVDVDATLARARTLTDQRERLVADELDFFRAENVAAVVADIPAIPLAAAKRAGLPATAVGNFSWDWIYGSFVDADPAWAPIVEGLREDYGQADCLLRLPFAPAMEVFRRQVNIPLLAKPGRRRRDEIARSTGADAGRQWILLSFTTLDWDEAARARVGELDGYEFFTVAPLSWPGPRFHAIDPACVAFADVVASVDAVVSKPGFGILSDCIANETPLIYAERESFIEYPLLVEAVESYLRNVHLPAAKLYRGKLAEALAAIRTRPDPPATMARGGAKIAAAAILESIDRA